MRDPCPSSPGRSLSGRVTRRLACGWSSPYLSNLPPASWDALTYNLQGLRWWSGLGCGCSLCLALPALLAELDESLDAPHIDDLPPQIH